MPVRRTAAVLAAGVLLPVVLTSCGVGRNAETYRERSTIDAVDASVGSLELRNVAIDPPAAGESELAAGKDARLTLSIVNTGDSADTLSSVSSPAASSAELSSGTGSSSGASAAASASPSAGSPAGGVGIPARAAVGSGAFSVTLRGLTAAVRPGQSIPVTFVFGSGSQQQLNVPVLTFASPAPHPSTNVFDSTGGGEG